MKLAARLSIAVVLVAAASVLVVGLLAHGLAKRATRNQVLDHARSVAAFQHLRVKRALSEYEDRFALVASRTQLRRTLREHRLDPDPVRLELIRQILADAAGSVRSIESIAILDDDRTALVASDPSVWADTEGRTFRWRGQDGRQLSLIVREDGAHRLVVEGPLAIEEEHLGHLAVRLRVDRLATITTERIGLGETGETILGLRDTNGDAVFLTPLRLDPERRHTRHRRQDNPDTPIFKALAGQTVTLTAVPDYRGVKVLAATQHIAGPDWGLVVKIDEAEAFAAVARIRDLTMLGVVVAALIVTTLAYLFWRPITAAIARLTRATERIRRGDLTERVSVCSRDELGRLASSFNAMLDQLAEARRALQVQGEQSARLAAIVESSTDAIVGQTLEGTVTSWNRAAERLFGFPAAEAIGQSVSAVVGNEQGEAEQESILASIRRDEPVEQLETIRRRRDGSSVDVAVSVSPVRDSTSRIVGASSIFHDITSVRRAERRFHSVVESAPHGMVLVDADGTILLVNAETERMFGYERHELIGRSVETLVPVSLRASHAGDRDRFFRHPERRSMGAGRDLHAVRQDGSEFPVEIGLNPIDTDAGIQVLSTIVDISERKRSEQAVLESEARFRALADAVPHLVWSARADGVHDYHNARLRAFSGRPEQNGPGDWSWLDAVHPDDREAVEADWAAALREGGEFRVDARLRRGAAGSYLWHTVHAVPMRGPDGGPRRWFGTCTNIDDRRRAQETIEQMNGELERTNAELERFLHTASHELKSPLVTIEGFLGHLLEDARAGRGDRLAHFAGHIKDASRRMRKNVDDLLELGRIGRQTAEPELVDTAELAGRILAGLGTELERRSVRVSLDPALPCLHTDPDALERIFDNLISNALKYGCDGPDPSIEIMAEPDGDGGCVVAVRDRGPGFEPQQCERVFGLFERLHAGVEGTGVGLAIVRRSAEDLGGRAWAESEPGRGATFRVAFPAGIVRPKSAATT